MHVAKHWDIFCRVIDNLGDIGVCWRLAADLAARGQAVRLWVDDGRALDWMAPGALQGRWPGVEVRDWALAGDAQTLAALAPADVWIEAFGCDIPDGFLAHQLRARKRRGQPAWINLEYLSAEPFAERSHGLPSPVMHGVARGCTKHFYYPGLTPAGGGLLREADLPARQARFDRAAWLAEQGIGWRGERLVSLFCYEPAVLGHWIGQLRADPRPTRLLVTQGRASTALQAVLGSRADHSGADGANHLTIDFLPPLTQHDFDHLLWSCDLNFVRGEDSLVRAIWAGAAFVWQIYPQHDGAHHAKLQAMLDALQLPVSLRQAHATWNALPGAASVQALQPDLPAWTDAAAAARRRLLGQSDLCTRLQHFTARAVGHPPSGPEKG